MPILIDSDETSQAATKLATLTGKTVEEAVGDALQQALARQLSQTSLSVRLKRLSERYRAYEETGLEADKAFFDEMSKQS